MGPSQTVILTLGLLMRKPATVQFMVVVIRRQHQKFEILNHQNMLFVIDEHLVLFHDLILIRGHVSEQMGELTCRVPPKYEPNIVMLQRE